MCHLPSPSEFSTLYSDAPQSELWAAVQGLLGKNGDLTAENEKLRARIAELEAKLKRPVKTPTNSSVPPSRGQKANRPAGEEPKKRTKASHPGVGRPLCETPDHTHVAVADVCPHCSAAVTADDQTLQQLYDRIEIPPIKPVVTQVRRHGGVCPCCQKKFLAPVPKGLEPGSPFGSSVVALAVDFHHNQAVSFERLVALFREVFDLKISEGAIGNMYKRSMPAFANQTDGIKARLLPDMLRVAVSVKAGRIRPSAILRRLSTYSRKNKLYFAFRELGRVIRTIFLLNYLSSLELRHVIQAATNKSELFNKYAQWVAFGESGLVAEGVRDEQRKLIKYNHLAANLLIFHTLVSMTRGLENLTAEGVIFTDAALAGLSPYQTEHINRFGNYTLDFDRIPAPLPIELPAARPPESRAASVSEQPSSHLPEPV